MTGLPAGERFADDPGRTFLVPICGWTRQLIAFIRRGMSVTYGVSLGLAGETERAMSDCKDLRQVAATDDQEAGLRNLERGMRGGGLEEFALSFAARNG